jgi:TadE-like protein
MLRRRGGEERGAVAVEMAVAVPVLVLLAFGMLEFGLAFSNKLELSQAVNQATRHATVVGNQDFADMEILGALDAGLSGNVSAIDEVLIFKAAPDGSPLVWDKYVPDGSACGWSPCPAGGAPVYGNPADYPPCDRETSLNIGVDTIGVQVAYTHSWISGVLGLPDQTWHESARARIEPDVQGVGNPSCP